MEIKIKYFSEDYPRLEKISQGDWIDLRVDNIGAEFSSHYYKKGQVIKFGLGVAMELPEGYEAEIRARYHGLILTNAVGIIDNSYCGDGDEWQAECIATRDGEIERFDRICQFRIWENQPSFNFKEVENLGNENRGGYGSTGKQNKGEMSNPWDAGKGYR